MKEKYEIKKEREKGSGRKMGWSRNGEDTLTIQGKMSVYKGGIEEVIM